MNILEHKHSRRAMLTGTAASAMAWSIVGQARAAETFLPGISNNYEFEVTRTDAEWMDLLGEDVFNIMRKGETEFPTTSPYWNNNDPGVYHCKGCDLPLYSSEWYSPQEIGFVFFKHADPDSVLTGIHTTDYNGALPEPKVMMEAHCRRCGGHLGHILLIGGEILHCINGTALELKPAEA
ncbi:MAG: peptide-methionine (R)-S-oxide reductase [Pseudomonadota bacterium]